MDVVRLQDAIEGGTALARIFDEIDHGGGRAAIGFFMAELDPAPVGKVSQPAVEEDRLC